MLLLDVCQVWNLCITHTYINKQTEEETNQPHQLTTVSGSAVLQNPNVDVRMVSKLKYSNHTI